MRLDSSAAAKRERGANEGEEAFGHWSGSEVGPLPTLAAEPRLLSKRAVLRAKARLNATTGAAGGSSKADAGPGNAKTSSGYTVRAGDGCITGHWRRATVSAVACKRARAAERVDAGAAIGESRAALPCGAGVRPSARLDDDGRQSAATTATHGRSAIDIATRQSDTSRKHAKRWCQAIE